jgi:hypothetical protein
MCTVLEPPFGYPTYLLTYSTVQSPSWEANWFAASREIPRISLQLTNIYHISYSFVHVTVTDVKIALYVTDDTVVPYIISYHKAIHSSGIRHPVNGYLAPVFLDRELVSKHREPNSQERGARFQKKVYPSTPLRGKKKTLTLHRYYNWTNKYQG